MKQPSKEQRKILKSYWVRLYLIYGTETFNFWHQPENLMHIYWITSGIVHSNDIRSMNYATFQLGNLTNFKFTQKFIDEVVNVE